MNTQSPVLSVVERLKHRAKLYQTVRDFFSQRKVLEVETPIFSPFANTDPFIQSLSSDFNSKQMYAHTSPEFAMKRLLCEGSGDIYQICKVFRVEELGRLHRPEFSMLEWYRLSKDYRQLADEVVELLLLAGIKGQAKYFTYQQLFQQFLNIDVLDTSAAALRDKALSKGLRDCPLGNDTNAWLSYLLTHIIEPELKSFPIVIIYEYPAEQAALAEISKEDARVALRFEVYSYGIELANGYQELTEPEVYLQRFEAENVERQNRNLPIMPIDKDLINSLSAGFPRCSGVALGLDRLLMLSLGKFDLSELEAL